MVGENLFFVTFSNSFEQALFCLEICTHAVVVGSQVFSPVFCYRTTTFCYLLSEFFLFFTGNSDWIFLYSVIFEDFVAFVAFFRLQSKNFEFFLI